MSYNLEEKEGSLYVTGHVGPGQKRGLTERYNHSTRVDVAEGESPFLYNWRNLARRPSP